MAFCEKEHFSEFENLWLGFEQQPLVGELTGCLDSQMDSVLLKKQHFWHIILTAINQTFEKNIGQPISF